jgi:hypothetical protein
VTLPASCSADPTQSRKTFQGERSAGCDRLSPAVDRLIGSAHSWRLALSALELIDLGLQALKFQAL